MTAEKQRKIKFVAELTQDQLESFRNWLVDDNERLRRKIDELTKEKAGQVKE